MPETNEQIGSLGAESADEAKTLVPSLQDKITDEELQTLLNDINKLSGYGM
jgi:DNA-directed RNA polymerase II subunit RPB4